MSVRRAALLGLLAAGLGGPVHAAWPGPDVPIRFAPEHDYGPFVFQRADGRIDGLSVELLGLVLERAELRVTTLPARPLQEQLDALRERRADLVSSLRPTPERGAYALFTAPYVSVPTLVVSRADRPALRLADLAGRPVAVGRGYAVEAVVRAQRPQVAWQAVSDDAVALAGVADGRFDAAVLDAASFAHLTTRQGVPGLHPVETIDFVYQLSFAVRGDWPELRDRLDAAIGAIPADRRQAIVERWLVTAPAPGRTPWGTRIGVALLGVGAVLFALAWTRRRRNEPAR